MSVEVAEIEVEVVFVGNGAVDARHAGVLQALGALGEPAGLGHVEDEDGFGFGGGKVLVEERLFGCGEGFGIFVFEKFEGAVAVAGQAVRGVILR